MCLIIAFVSKSHSGSRQGTRLNQAGNCGLLAGISLRGSGSGVLVTRGRMFQGLWSPPPQQRGTCVGRKVDNPKETRGAHHRRAKPWRREESPPVRNGPRGTFIRRDPVLPARVRPQSESHSRRQPHAGGELFHFRFADATAFSQRGAHPGEDQVFEYFHISGIHD